MNIEIKITKRQMCAAIGLFWVVSSFIYAAFDMAWWVSTENNDLRALIMFFYHAIGVFALIASIPDGPWA